MNWNQLQYVITIAEEKSITKAAQKLYISQPSLSLSIQALEKETGIPLFKHSSMHCVVICDFPIIVIASKDSIGNERFIPSAY